MLTKADREPLIMSEAAVEPPVNSVLDSYWQRVWRYFTLQRGGVIAGLCITTLLLLSFVAPVFYQVDPNLQNIGNRFAGFQPARQVDIVDDAIWSGLAADTPRVVVANTEYVRLAWPNTQAPFRIVRSRANSAEQLNLAVSETNWYEDRFDLRAETYIYRVFDADDKKIAELQVTPTAAISKFYAALAGYTQSEAQAVLTMPPRILGTDGLGRDNLARLMSGGRISLTIGLLAPLLAIAIGAFYGAVSAFVGGWLDELLMRIADIVIALPFLLFVILLNVAFGYGPASDGVAAMFLALVLMGWPNAAKLVRGQVLRLRQYAYIDAARLMGGSNFYIIKTHILPSVLGTVLVALSFAIPNAIFTEALLSFLGLGVKAPAASWGSLCQENLHELQRYPHLLLMPAALISLTVLAFNLLGDSLRDALAQAGGGGRA